VYATKKGIAVRLIFGWVDRFDIIFAYEGPNMQDETDQRLRDRCVSLLIST
jgi:hypothetical protein